MARLSWPACRGIDVYERSFLSAEARALIGVKAAPAAVAKDELRGVDAAVRAAVVGALLPADPARLWTEGPDVAAAAEVWNAEVGKRVAVPEELLGDAIRAFRHASLADPASSARPAGPGRLAPAQPGPRPGRSTATGCEPVGDDTAGFTAQTLVGTVGSVRLARPPAARRRPGPRRAAARASPPCANGSPTPD